MEGAEEEAALAFQSIMTLPFQKAIRGLKSTETKSQVYQTMRSLAGASWPGLKVAVHDTSSAMGVPIGKDAQIIFRVFETKPKRTLCYYDIVSSGKVKATLQRIADENSVGNKSMQRQTMAFTKIIPDWALQSQQGIEEILRLEKANLLLTQEQESILHLPPPLLIHGRAGSGKTLLTPPPPAPPADCCDCEKSRSKGSA